LSKTPLIWIDDVQIPVSAIPDGSVTLGQYEQSVSTHGLEAWRGHYRVLTNDALLTLMKACAENPIIPPLDESNFRLLADQIAPEIQARFGGR